LTPFIIFFEARFCFVWFTCERSVDAVATSWQLTAGSILLASIVPAALAWIPSELVAGSSAYLMHSYRLLTPPPQFAALTTIAAFVAFAWVYPLIARWLTMCTGFHPDSAPSTDVA
jgi:hypothetical protein